MESAPRGDWLCSLDQVTRARHENAGLGGNQNYLDLKRKLDLK